MNSSALSVIVFCWAPWRLSGARETSAFASASASCWDWAAQIKQRVHFDGCFRRTKIGPWKQRQTQIDRREKFTCRDCEKMIIGEQCGQNRVEAAYRRCSAIRSFSPMRPATDA